MIEIEPNFFTSILAYGNDSFLGTLADDPHKTGFKLHILNSEVDELRDPQAGRIKQLQHGSVAYAGGLGAVRCVQKTLDLGDAEHVRQLESGLGQVDESRRVERQNLFMG